jgi:redox-sensing transcriptional repressor
MSDVKEFTAPDGESMINDIKVKIGKIPAKTVERLVQYRILLEDLKAMEKTHIFSNEVARLLGNTPTQVRRDLMVVGYNGNPRNGYGIDDLLKSIRSLLEPEEGITMAIAGVGNLGRALLGYFSLLQPRFKIIGAFDTDPHKVNRTIAGYRILHTSEIGAQLARQPAQLGIITVPAEQAQKAADVFVAAGVRGVVNFASMPLRVPPEVWLENIQITLTLEKVAYFSRMKQMRDNS